MPTVTLRQLAKRSEDDNIRRFVGICDWDSLILDEATILRFPNLYQLAVCVIPDDRLNDYLKAANAADNKFRDDTDKLRVHQEVAVDGVMRLGKEYPERMEEALRRGRELGVDIARAQGELRNTNRLAKAKAILEILNQCSST